MGVIQAVMGSYAGGPGYDPDALPYINALIAAGVNNPTINDAWNTFVVGAKSTADAFWTEFVVCYPFAGGIANAHAINAKNPGTFNITWNGTVTHNVNGIAGNATDGYGDTGLNPSTALTLNDIHMAVYSRTNSTANRFEMGCLNVDASNTMQFQIRTTSDTSVFTSFDIGGGSILTATSVTSSLGMFIASRRASNDAEVYRNGSSIGTQTGNNGGARPNFNMFICGRNNNGSLNSPTSRNYAFASIGSALSDAQAAYYSTLVQAFETSLGRQV